MPPESSNSSKLKVFVSYCHKDEELKDDLCAHLAPLTRQEKIEIWQDRALEAGTEWDDVIKTNFEKADVILLLITSWFINSDYCYAKELRWAIDRHDRGEARVIPIMMKPCDWQGAPFSKLAFLPKDGKPVTTWENQDEALMDAAKGIRRVVEALAKK